MSTVTTWADSFGIWHARVPAAAAWPLGAARRALRGELTARQSSVARWVWLHAARVPALDTADGIVYREAIDGTCRHCDRRIILDTAGRWVDPDATGDDSVWSETCDAHDTIGAEHEPANA